MSYMYSYRFYFDLQKFGFQPRNDIILLNYLDISLLQCLSAIKGCFAHRDMDIFTHCTCPWKAD